MSKSVRNISMGILSLALVACSDDEPLTSRDGPSAPPPLSEGIQAFLQVDNDQAQPGELVHVFVRVQLASASSSKLGSYTGRLVFDPTMVSYESENEINDGLRVTNPGESDGGIVRFAGASPGGFEDLTLYEGIFRVRNSDYLDGLSIEMEELSEATTISDMTGNLSVSPGVFLRDGTQ